MVAAGAGGCPGGSIPAAGHSVLLLLPTCCLQKILEEECASFAKDWTFEQPSLSTGAAKAHSLDLSSARCHSFFCFHQKNKTIRQDLVFDNFKSEI